MFSEKEIGTDHPSGISNNNAATVPKIQDESLYTKTHTQTKKCDKTLKSAANCNQKAKAQYNYNKYKYVNENVATNSSYNVGDKFQLQISERKKLFLTSLKADTN